MYSARDSIVKQRLLLTSARRALWFWCAAHLIIALLTPGGALLLSPPTVVALAAVASVIGILETRRRHELLFLHNLGVDTKSVGLTWAASVVVAELLAASLVAPLTRLL